MMKYFPYLTLKTIHPAITAALTSCTQPCKLLHSHFEEGYAYHVPCTGRGAMMSIDISHGTDLCTSDKSGWSSNHTNNGASPQAPPNIGCHW